MIYDFNAFKSFMLNPLFHHESVISYCLGLDDEKWAWFHSQVIQTSLYISNKDFIFYAFKWIVDKPFSDLRYEVYCCHFNVDVEFNFDSDLIYTKNHLNYLNYLYYEDYENEYICSIDNRT